MIGIMTRQQQEMNKRMTVDDLIYQMFKQGKDVHETQKELNRRSRQVFSYEAIQLRLWRLRKERG